MSTAASTPWTLVPLRWTRESAKLTGVLALISVPLVISYRRWWSTERLRRKKSVVVEELSDVFGRNTVIIHAFPKGSSRACYSPFTVKMETFLRIHRLRYVVRSDDFISPFARGSPWIVYDGKVYEDVDEAIGAISVKNGIDMDLHLSRPQRAVSRAFQMMLEHHLYWLILAERWVHDHGQFMWDFVPKSASTWYSRLVMRRTIGAVVTKMEALTYSHGLGRKSHEEVMQAALEDIGTLEDFLQNKRFLMGERCCRADCTVFAFLRIVILSRWTSFRKVENKDDLAHRFPNCTAYVKRILSLYFPAHDQ